MWFCPSAVIVEPVYADSSMKVSRGLISDPHGGLTAQMQDIGRVRTPYNPSEADLELIVERLWGASRVASVSTEDAF